MRGRQEGPERVQGTLKGRQGSCGCCTQGTGTEMDNLVAYVTDEENLVTVMGGAIAVAAALIGGATLVSSGPAAVALEEPDSKGTPQAPRIGGRQKKASKHSKPVLPKKEKRDVKGAKQKWEQSSDEEEEVVPEPVIQPPVAAQGKKKKKGKKAAEEPAAPVEDTWVEIPKKEKKKKAAAVAVEVKGGKTVIDLGDKKSAVIGKGGSVIKGIQVRPSHSLHATQLLLTARVFSGVLWGKHRH